MKLIVAGSVAIGMGAHAAPAHAETVQESASYSVFDLSLRRIPVLTTVGDERVDGQPTFLSGVAPGVCVTEPREARHVIVPDPEASCPLFNSREPGKVVVQLVKLKGNDRKTTIITASMPTYPAFRGSAVIEGTDLRIRGLSLAAADTALCAAYFDPRKSSWQTIGVSRAPADVDLFVPLRTSEVSGAIYLRYGDCPADASVTLPAAAIVKVAYPQPATRELTSEQYCEQPEDSASTQQFRRTYLEPANRTNYCISIHQANALGQARIIENKQHYISTFSWGRVVIRHWPSVVPVLTINGGTISIRQPGLAGTSLEPLPAAAAPTAASAAGFVLPPSTDGQGTYSEPQGDGSVLSQIYIPPHAAGPMHLDIRFLDPGDSKPKAATAVDLVVDQGYSGAFRLGISHVLFSPEHHFTKLQRFKDAPLEITEKTGSPSEVVVGYSMYFAGAGGRTYALRGPWYLDRWGLFLGFGVVGYTPGQPIDVLRSIHVGPEFEISRHLTLALTGVVRRQTQLEGVTVGGPAPEGDIPTSTSYDVGLGLVLAFSPDFVKVVGAGGVK